MAVEMIPGYRVICDRCGRTCPGKDDDYVSMGPEPKDALEYAGQQENWIIREEFHHCPECDQECERCLQLTGPGFEERDYLCQSCWDAEEAADE